MNNWKKFRRFFFSSKLKSLHQREKSSLRNLSWVIIYSHSSQGDVKSCLKFLHPDIFAEQKPTQICTVSARRALAYERLGPSTIWRLNRNFCCSSRDQPPSPRARLGSQRAEQPASPHIITGLREAIKPGLGRLPPCTNLLPSGLRAWSRCLLLYASVIDDLGSGLCEPILVFINRRIRW